MIVADKPNIERTDAENEAERQAQADRVLSRLRHASVAAQDAGQQTEPAQKQQLERERSSRKDLV